MTQRYTRRTPDQWQSIVDEQASSGLCQVAFCKRHEIAYGTFQTWRKKLIQQPLDDAAPFVELPRTDYSVPPLPLDQGLRVRLDLGAGVVLELSRA